MHWVGLLSVKSNTILWTCKKHIDADRAVNYECDSAGTQLNYQVLSDTVSAVRKSKCRAEMSEAMVKCSAPIRADYAKRHRKYDE